METPRKTARNRPYLGRAHIPTGYGCGGCGGVPSFQVLHGNLECQFVRIASVDSDRFCTKVLRANADETRAYGYGRYPCDDRGNIPEDGVRKLAQAGAESRSIQGVTRDKRSPRWMQSRSCARRGHAVHPLGMLIPKRHSYRPKSSASSFLPPDDSLWLEEENGFTIV